MGEPVFTLNAKRFNKVIKKYPSVLRFQVEKGLEKALEIAVKDIQTNFNGSPLGFSDRTGALRRSITSTIKGHTPDAVIGSIGAGDNSIGSNGKATKDYVTKIEFGEFSQAGVTAFLRPGVLSNVRLITKVLTAQVARLLK